MGERVDAVTWSGLYGEPYREVANNSEQLGNGGISAFHIGRCDTAGNGGGWTTYQHERAGNVIHSI